MGLTVLTTVVLAVAHLALQLPLPCSAASGAVAVADTLAPTQDLETPTRSRILVRRSQLLERSRRAYCSDSYVNSCTSRDIIGMCRRWRGCNDGQRFKESLFDAGCYSCCPGKSLKQGATWGKQGWGIGAKWGGWNEKCDSCSPGQFQDEEGQRTCKSCPIGKTAKYSGSTGSTTLKETCDNCNVGRMGRMGNWGSFELGHDTVTHTHAHAHTCLGAAA